MRGLRFVAVAATVLIAVSAPSFAAGQHNDLNAARARSEKSAAEAGEKVLGSSVNDWVFTTVPSCPLLDTRAGSGVQGDGTGPITPGTPYAFNVKGLCGIPATAKAIAVNFIAIGAPGNGNLRVWPWDSSSPAQPNTAIITYTVGFNTSNAGDIGICNTATSTGGLCTDDLFIQTNVNSAHVKADVFGYFSAPTSSTVPGTLINQLEGQTGAPSASGYFNIVTNYVPPVNARAFTFMRCSEYGTGPGQNLLFRSAFRNPTGGTVNVGNAFYLEATTSGTNSVFNQNNDFFDLTAGESYDFGINLIDSPPSENGWCSAVVQIFSR